MSQIQITTSNGRLSAVTPFNPSFPASAKKLGGRWDAGSKAWTFDARDEVKVRELCVRLFGTDGSPIAAADLLTIRAPAGVCTNPDGTSLWLAGRQVARVLGRDSGARLGEGVVVVAGSFGSGGSVKNPRVVTKEGTVFELRDVPRALAEKVHAEFHGVALLDAQGAVVAEATHAEPEPVVEEVPVVETPSAPPAILPMQIDVARIVRYIATTSPKGEPLTARGGELERDRILGYFAPEDREGVAPVVNAVLAEKMGGAS